MIRIGLGVLCCLFLTPVAFARGIDPATAARIDSLLDSFDDSSSPGVAVGVFANGDMLFHAEYGMADIANRVPVTDSTLFYIGSMAKQFTAYAAFMLVRSGQLSLDGSIGPSFREAPGVLDSVTVRHLLYHTSGVRDFISLAQYAGLRRGLDFLSQEEIERMILSQPGLNFRPGEAFSYSNSNYWLLARIIDGLSAGGFEEFVKDSIFRPLGMRQSYFTVDPRDVAPHQAHGYARRDSGAWYRSFPVYSTLGAGGMFTSLQDLGKWDKVFYESGKGAFSIVDSMVRPFTLNSGKSTGEGAGIIEDEYRGKRMQHHSGNTIGFGCEMMRFPDDTITIAVLFNTELRWANPTSIAHRLADMIVFRDSVGYSSPQISAPPAVSSKIVVDSVWKGLYLLEDGTTLEFRAETSGLGVSVDGGRLMVSEIEGDTLLRVKNRSWRVRRASNEQGQAPDTLEFTLGAGDEAQSYPLYRPLPVSGSDVKRFSGRYTCRELDAEWSIRMVDGSLAIANGRSRGARFIAEHLYRYGAASFTDGELAYYTFEMDDSGNVTSVELTDPRLRGIRFERAGR